jgi:hypothetical protein
MTMPGGAPSVDDYINSVSDQLAAWYSIVSGKPVVVPSAQILAQQNLANAPIPVRSGQVFNPDTGQITDAIDPTWILLIAGGVLIYFLVK